MWTPGAIETCGGYWDGKYYGIPFELSDYVAWINTAFMKEAGPEPQDGHAQDVGPVRCGGEEAREGQDGGVTVRNGFMCNSKEGVFNFLVLPP